VQFITAHADRVTVDGLRWGVEPIRAVLASQGIPIAASTYYAARAAARVGPMSAALREAELIDHIRRVHAAHFGVYGARKVWLSLNREGVPVARCTVERLMGQLGLVGALRGKVKRTTIPGPAADRPGGLVRRRFDPAAPNRLWVADFTYVSAWSGWVYVAFVIDAYSRRILGWRCSTAMTTPLVLDAVEQAIWTRAQAGVSDLAGLVHHSDRGSQYGALAMTDRLLSAGIDPSVGATGSSYDNALAENDQRPLQDRADQTARAVEDPGTGRDRDPGVGRLVQPPPAQQLLRRHAPRRARGRLLPSPPDPATGRGLNRVSLRTRRGGSAHRSSPDRGQGAARGSELGRCRPEQLGRPRARRTVRAGPRPGRLPGPRWPGVEPGLPSGVGGGGGVGGGDRRTRCSIGGRRRAAGGRLSARAQRRLSADGERAGLTLVWRGRDRGNPDAGAVRLVYADRPLAGPVLNAFTLAG